MIQDVTSTKMITYAKTEIGLTNAAAGYPTLAAAGPSTDRGGHSGRSGLSGHLVCAAARYPTPAAVAGLQTSAAALVFASVTSHLLFMTLGCNQTLHTNSSSRSAAYGVGEL